MAPLKGEDESWFGNANEEQQRTSTDCIAVRSSSKTQEVLKRQPTTAAGEAESDGEDDNSGCWFFRGRSMSRKLYSSRSDLKGGPFERLVTDDPESTKAKMKYQRSRSACATIFCCCGSRHVQTNYTTVEVRAVDAAPKQSRKWEVDVNEEYSKPPYWKQLIRKVKAQCHARHQSRSDWLNYDAHSYQMNFDDGRWRENCVLSLYANENDDSVTRARAMHAALLEKIATSRTQQDSPGSPISPGLSPLPVKMVSKEEIEKSKEGFVPIWQRRQGAPPIKLDLRQRSGPMED